MGELSWRAAGLTDVGCVRTENQDNYFLSRDNCLLVVADGMGGAEGGATASQLTVDTLSESWDPELANGSNTEAIRAWLEETIQKANTKVREAAKQSKDAKNMGTTVVVGVQAANDELHIAHVGDSRAYVIREGKAQLLTNDHSVVFEMYKKGQLSYEQCRSSPWRNLITRCVGHDDEVKSDYISIKLQPGDIVILATDGLSGQFDDDQLVELIGARQEAEPICKELVSKTLESGAPDNVTVIASSYVAACVDSSSAN